MAALPPQMGAPAAQAQPGTGPGPGMVGPGPSPRPQAPPQTPIPLHTGDATISPKHPIAHFDTQARKRLTEGEWSALSNDLYMSWLASTSARQPFDNNLQAWAQQYDMIAGSKNFPFEESSNILLPYLASQLESMAAYITGTALVPRLYMVSPAGSSQDPEDAESAFQLERWYNQELLRLRADGSSYFSRQADWIHIALRDGTGILEVLWNRRRQRKRTVSYVPQVNPQTGQPMLDETGMPLWEPRANDVDVYIKDYPEMTVVPLKEFYLIPNEARDIESAAGVARVEWLYEDQLDRMVRAGLLDSDEVERALAYVPMGTSDVAADPERIYDKNASNQMEIGQGQGSLTSEFFVNRGPIKVVRIHSREYDMNGDGISEENIFWIHEISQRMLGWIPYDYGTGHARPFFAWCPFPRPDNFYGYSLPERFEGVVSEMNAVHNARRDHQDQTLSPPMAVKDGAKFETDKGTYRPGTTITVDSLSDADPTFRLLEMPDVPPSSWQEEALLKSYGNEYTGLNQPAMGGQSSGRRSATELRQQNAASNVRINLIVARLRLSLAQVINFVHSLNKQYLQTSPVIESPGAAQTIPLEAFSSNVAIAVAGTSDPIDSITRRNENMTLFDLAMKVPFVASNPMRVWYWLRSLLESFGRSDVYQLIGTEQEMQQMFQMQQQQQQTARQVQEQGAQADVANKSASADLHSQSALLKQAETMNKLGEALAPDRREFTPNS